MQIPCQAALLPLQTLTSSMEDYLASKYQPFPASAISHVACILAKRNLKLSIHVKASPKDSWFQSKVMTVHLSYIQQSPLKDLLAMRQREHVADMVNAAIIAAELKASASKEMPLVSQAVANPATLKMSCCIWKD